MNWLTVKVDDEKFIQWAERTENAFVYMINTMKDVAEVVRENTLPITPFETGRLGRSFKTFVLTDSSREKLIMVRMSALNPNTGYDYAWIQHENPYYNHFKPLKGKPQKSRRWHENLFMWGQEYTSGYDEAGTHKGDWHYLKEGIIESQEGAFQLIEEDYLSLFKRGNII